MGVETDLEVLWTYVPCPTLLVDQAGVIRASSESAQSLLPGAISGSRLEEAAEWLSRAHQRLVKLSSGPHDRQLPFVSGSVGGRKFDAYPATWRRGCGHWQKGRRP
jgi:hypothetical protein